MAQKSEPCSELGENIKWTSVRQYKNVVGKKRVKQAPEERSEFEKGVFYCKKKKKKKSTGKVAAWKL